FDVPPKRRSAELSGGTRAKLSLALALAPRPPLLLLDEPTAGLDPVARREFNELLLALHRERGATVLFSSHLVSEVELLARSAGVTRALLGKELREHQWIIAAVVVLFAGLDAVSLFEGSDERGALESLQQQIALYGVIAALVFANRLVVREYTGRTQLFLEA